MQGHPLHAPAAGLRPAHTWLGKLERLQAGEMKQDELQLTLLASLFPNPKLFLPSVWRSLGGILRSNMLSLLISLGKKLHPLRTATKKPKVAEDSPKRVYLFMDMPSSEGVERMLPTGAVQYSLKSQWGFSFSTFYLEALTISPLSKCFFPAPKRHLL